MFARRAAAALSFATVVLGVSLGSACGAAPPASGVGNSHVEPGARPVELALVTEAGALVDVGDFRGQTVLLFIFATYDGVSQAALTPVSRFVRHHPEVYVLGVAAQPNPRALLDAWKAALNPPFAVAYSPEDRVTTGTSDLGALGAIPTFVVLNAQGFEVARHTGMVSEDRLEEMTAPVSR